MRQITKRAVSALWVIALSAILPGCFAPSDTLNLWLQDIESASGHVAVGGVDTARPSRPFLFVWGDGTADFGWFPKTHVYSDRSRDYEVMVTAYYDSGRTDTEILLVPFLIRSEARLGVSIHGIGEYSGSLFLSDWSTGETYSVSLDGDTIQPGQVTLPQYVCDFVIEGSAIYAVSEAGREVVKYSLETGLPIDRIAISSSAGLGAYDIQGIEKNQGTMYLLGSNRTDGKHQYCHLVSVLDSRTGHVEGVYSLESSRYPDLIGLQWFDGDLWTFDHNGGRLMKMKLRDGALELEPGLDVFERLLLRKSELASGGLRGFYLHEEGIVFSSIPGPDEDASVVHILETQ